MQSFSLHSTMKWIPRDKEVLKSSGDAFAPPTLNQLNYFSQENTCIWKSHTCVPVILSHLITCYDMLLWVLIINITPHHLQPSENPILSVWHYSNSFSMFRETNTRQPSHNPDHTKHVDVNTSCMKMQGQTKTSTQLHLITDCNCLHSYLLTSLLLFFSCFSPSFTLQNQSRIMLQMCCTW